MAYDVAKTLGYKRPSEATRQHCKEKGMVKHRILTDGGEQDVLLINEPNVSQVPNFYIRYQDNFHKIDKNYFIKVKMENK